MKWDSAAGTDRAASLAAGGRQPSLDRRLQPGSAIAEPVSDGRVSASPAGGWPGHSDLDIPRTGDKSRGLRGDYSTMLNRRRPSAATLVAILFTLAIGTQTSLAAQAAPQRTSTYSRKDTSPPQPVRTIDVTAAHATDVAVQWSRSRDNVAVLGYGVYLDGSFRGGTLFTNYTLRSLRCGTGYSVGVDAFDLAGNRPHARRRRCRRRRAWT